MPATARIVRPFRHIRKEVFITEDADFYELGDDEMQGRLVVTMGNKLIDDNNSSLDDVIDGLHEMVDIEYFTEPVKVCRYRK